MTLRLCTDRFKIGFKRTGFAIWCYKEVAFLNCLSSQKDILTQTKVKQLYDLINSKLYFCRQKVEWKKEKTDNNDSMSIKFSFCIVCSVNA